MPLVKSLFRFFFVTLAFVLGGIVCSVNTDPVVINVPFAEPIRTPMAIILLGSFMFGTLTVVLQFGIEVARKTMTIRRLSKQIEKLESQQRTSNRDESSPQVQGNAEPSYRDEALASD